MSRPLITLLVALVFGLVDAALKGHHGGLSDAAGNVSATWLILPLLAGAFVARNRPVVGAAAGLVSVITALVAFYVIGGYVLSLGVGPHSTVHALSLNAGVTNRWFESGAIAGLGLGSVGAWLAGRGSLGQIGAIVAALLLFEPATRAAYMAVHGVAPVGSTVVWGFEVATGLAAALAALCMRRLNWLNHPAKRQREEG